MEIVFKNEIKKSRSLEFINVIGALMAKYNHIIYYPFRDRTFEKYDLLKPKSTFFVLLVVTSLCIVWMITIFLSSVLQAMYTDVTSIELITFILCTVGISVLSSVLNIITINRLFRLYSINIKNAFKMDYGHQYVPMNQDLIDEQENQNILSQEEIQKQEELLANFQSKHEQFGNLTLLPSSHKKDNSSNINNMNSTRKLLEEETQKTKILYEEDNLNGPSKNQEKLGMTTKGQSIMDIISKKAIKDILELQVKIRGIDKAADDQKYIFIQDEHAIGDVDFLKNEALKGENTSNMISMVLIFLVLAASAIVCCYLNYQFVQSLSIKVFYMFAGAFVGDLLVFRMLFILFASMIKFLYACCKGYKKIEYQKKKEVNNLLNTAIKDMFFSHGRTPGEAETDDNVGKKLLQKTPEEYEQERSLKKMLRAYMNKHEDLSYRQDTSVRIKKLGEEDEESKEDEFARIINDEKGGDDDQWKPKVQDNLHVNYAYMNPLSEVEPLGLQKKGSQTPLIKNLQKEIFQNEEDKFSNLMDKKQIVNELVDYNLLLLRTIYDAYEERADKVLGNFRSDDTSILRKKYMIPIINPNYPFEKLLEDIRNQKNNREGGKGEEEGFLEGEMGGEDQDQQEIEGIKDEIGVKSQEELEEEENKKVLREAIDKFGRAKGKIDEYKFVLPMPAKGQKEYELEEEANDDDADEWSKKKKELAMLRAKKARGEDLTKTEQNRLVELEQEEDKYRHEDIEDLEKNQQRSSEEDQRLKELLDEEEEYRNRRIDELLEKKDFQGLNEEEQNELQKLLDWRKSKRQKQIDELNEKMKTGKITEEERKRLIELEEEEMNELYQKLARGEGLTEEELRRLEILEKEKLKRINNEIEELLSLGEENLTDEQRLKLIQLQKEKYLLELEQLKRKKPPRTEEEERRIKEIEEELERLEYQELLMKKKLGLLTEEEMERLRYLEQKFKMMDEVSIIEKTEDQNINDENEENMLDKDKVNVQENEENKDQEDEQASITEIASRISEKDDYADLPPVEVMNNAQSKPVSPQQNVQREKIDLENIQEHNVENDEQNQQVEEAQNLFQKNEEDINFDDKQVDDIQNNQNNLNNNEDLFQEENVYGEEAAAIAADHRENNNRDEEQNKNIENIQKNSDHQEENQENKHIVDNDHKKMSQEEIDEEMKKKISQKEIEDLKHQEEMKKKLSQEEQDELNRQEELQKQISEKKLQEQRENEEMQKKLSQKEQEEIQKKLSQEEINKRQSDQELIDKQNEQNKKLSQKELEELQKQKQQEEEEQRKLSEKQLSQEELQRLQEQEDIQKKQSLKNQEEQLLSESELAASQRNKQLQEELERLRSSQSKKSFNNIMSEKSLRQSMNSQKSLIKSQISQKSKKSLIQQDSIRSKQSALYRPQTADSQEAMDHRPSSIKQSRLDQQRLRQPIEEDEIDRMSQEEIMSKEDIPPSDIENQQMIEFGREDLEMDAPLGPNGEPDESIYSHKTTTILDEEKVSFMHIEHLPNQDGASDESFSEQDMVYYNKDDLTNYSKGLGLNRVKAKRQSMPSYFSENDIREISENERQNNDESSAGGSLEPGTRGRMGRGTIKHNDLDIQSYNDNIDGRVKVDSWNLNYSKKKKKLKKKKLDKDSKKKMNDLQNIYGVDAKTLAGLQKGALPKQQVQNYKDSPSKYNTIRDTENSFRSTQNTFMKNQSTANKNFNQQSLDGASNMFSFNGKMSKRFNDGDSGFKANQLLKRPSRQQDLGDEEEKIAKRLPMSGMKRMTETQKKFAQGLNQQQDSDQDNSRSRSRPKKKNISNNDLIGSHSKGGFDQSKNLNNNNNDKLGLDMYKQFKSQNNVQNNARNALPFRNGTSQGFNEEEERKSEDDFEIQDAGLGNQSRPQKKFSQKKLADSHLFNQQKRSLQPPGTIGTLSAGTESIGNFMKDDTQSRGQFVENDTQSRLNFLKDDTQSRGSQGSDGNRGLENKHSFIKYEDNQKSNHQRDNSSLKKKGGKSKTKATGKQHKKRNSNGSAEDGYESHTESDEAVDGQKANFQRNNEMAYDDEVMHRMRNKDNVKKNLINDLYQGTGSVATNEEELDHTESDEGINQEKPNFDGNEFLFKRRSVPDGGNNLRSNSNSKVNKNMTGFYGQNHENEIAEVNEFDDLEAQNNSRSQHNVRIPVHGNQGQNLGPNFYGGGTRGQTTSNERSDNSDIEMHGINRKGKTQLQAKRDSKNSEEQKQKGSNKHRSNAKQAFQSEEISQFQGGDNETSLRKNPNDNSNYNSKRKSQQTYAQSDQSDHDRQNKLGVNVIPQSKLMTETDNEFISGNKKKQKYMSQSPVGAIGSRQQSQEQRTNQKGTNNNQKYRNRSLDDDGEEIDGDQYLVGPASNHSMVRSRGGQDSGLRESRSQDRYLLLNRDRDVTVEQFSNNSKNKGKKRNVRRAVHNPKRRQDEEFKQIQDMQNERLKRMQREAEKAMFKKGNNGDDSTIRELEKIKKKKQKKDWVKKEVNYWLDYDSPYAEYLVARFREWSPQVKPPVSRGASQNRQGVQKINELQNVYQNNEVSRLHDRRISSQSPDRQGDDSTQLVVMGRKRQSKQESNHKPTPMKVQKHNSSNLQVNSFQQRNDSQMQIQDIDDMEEP